MKATEEMIQTRRSKSETYTLTERRKENLRKALPEVRWDFANAELRRAGWGAGWGEKPQFRIPGKVKGFDVTWTHRAPTGAGSYLRIFKNGKRITTCKTSLRDANKHLLQFIQTQQTRTKKG